MAIALVRPGIDLWAPGEHNGTFRGNALAFVAATEALALWEEGLVEDAAARRAEEIADWTRRLLARWPGRGLSARGLGMMSGVAFAEPGMADAVARRAFELGVMIETAGPNDEVLKLFPALTIDPATLADGLGRIAAAVADVLTAGEEVGLVA
ncbi:aminotransferase class III-fold pyridoxal phosphate-dependent enzyme [Chenggangzhangella methanolivorans]|nr:aminotransferase class III-fold pyridoxal phosphate-dependent enzyme [Chenggangzhangella methanolivorans]